LGRGGTGARGTSSSLSLSLGGYSYFSVDLRGVRQGGEGRGSREKGKGEEEGATEWCDERANDEPTATKGTMERERGRNEGEKRKMKKRRGHTTQTESLSSSQKRTGINPMKADRKEDKTQGRRNSRTK
jgi:hypothetical protein